MNLKKSLGVFGAGTVAALVFALAAPLAASAATPTGPADSSHDVWLSSSTNTPVLLAPTAAPKLNASVYASKSSDPADRAWAMPSGAVYEYEFLSARGKERAVDDWTIYSDRHTDPGANVNLKVSNFPTANPGKSFDQVGTVGGDFSLGLAFVNAQGQVIESNYVYITITPNAIATAATYEFSTPVSAPVEVAPAITTQPTNATVNPGASATFTAAASGTPAPTVKWQSSTNGTTWADVADATAATLTVANGVTGTQYRAVFTNSKGSATTSAATLTVSKVEPTQPTGTDANKFTVVDPAAGVNTITIPAGAANANKTLTAWAWSTPTNLGNVQTDASGNAIVDISSLPAGAHTVALTQPGDATYTVLAWGTFTKTANAGDTLTDNVDLTATVTASDLWSLNAEKTAVNFGNVARGATASAALGKVTVIDDRSELKGWNLTAAASAFTKGTDSIPASALAIVPSKFGTTTLPTGITAGTNGANFATSASQVSTGTAGALFDAALTFTAPSSANAGEYHSTLTLTLTSK